jgi:enoyl-CoA hydratase/carnithine racemase/predicted thioesterase
MHSGLNVGAEAELVWRVAAEHAIHLGYPPPSVAGGLNTPPRESTSVSAVVFSTPNMILLMERAARKVLEPYLEPGEVSVGTSVNIEHLGGAPIGAEVRATARVTSVERRSIGFEVTAEDRFETIGRGHHGRAVVPLRKIAERIAEKANSPSGPMPLSWMDGIAGLPATSDPVDERDTQQTGDSMSGSSKTGGLPMTDALRVEITGPLATVTLDRPEKKNAVNVRMTEEWERLNHFFAQHPEIRIVLVHGAGGAFCAGDDVPEVGTLEIAEARELSYRQARVYLGWEQLPQVFMAAVDGEALGAGCVVACACDLRIASHRAQFGMPEILLGWPPGYGVAQLTALIGKSRAMELCLTGEPITARKAYEDGLVHRLVSSGTLLEEARKWSHSLLALPAEALRATKQCVHADEGLQPKVAFLGDTAAYVHCLQQPDAREGIAAFREKRRPDFPSVPPRRFSH